MDYEKLDILLAIRAHPTEMDSESNIVIRLSREEWAQIANACKAPKKTREEVEQLKANWKNDPCFDLETTEGFEEYRDELYVYRLETENANLLTRLQRLTSVIGVLRAAQKALDKIASEG